MTNLKDRERPGLADELRLSVGLLTRIPVSPGRVPVDGWLHRSCRWFPLVGAMVGGFAAAVLCLSTLVGVPGEATAILSVAGAILMTGAIHEDGLADVADGFAGGRTREDRLRIMRDSRIGTYGALALILSVGVRWAAVTALLRHGTGPAALALIVSASVSRLTPVLLMRFMAAARDDGLGATAGRPSPATTGTAIVLSLMAVLPLLWLRAPAAAITVVLAALVAFASVAAIARRRIGGQTGDVLGAGQQLSEMLILLGLAATLPS